MLVGVGYWLTQQQDARQQQSEDRRAQDTALQAYLDQMSGLMIGDEPLRDSEEGSAVRTLARARTLTILVRVDPSRKAEVMQFLTEARLVQGDPHVDPPKKPIISLLGADLTGADLTEADLYGADLYGADLSGADLSGAFLPYADLTGAVLSGADLTSAVLSGADLTDANMADADLYDAEGVTKDDLEQQTHLLGGATMYDGSKYP
jgi:uncharacterized protein YjbI with pentapeptide repeats